MLRIGILGTAKIAGEFVRGVKRSRKVSVPAVASRDASRAKRFAREHGIGKAFDSYAALLADPDIDAVYNPLPNALHAEWSIKALESGKHVLCEKPLAMSGGEAEAMFGAAANIRLDPALGGGALMDAGCYPISLIRVVAGQCPVRVHAMAGWISAGVDKTVAATFEFASGLLAQISCGFGTAVHRHALIAGSAGIIETAYMNNPALERPATMQIRRGTSWESVHRQESVEAPAMNGFLAEAESFCELVNNGPGHWSGAAPAESIDIARMIDAIKRSARTGNAEPVSR